MSTSEREAQLMRMKEVLDRHREALLRLPGCTGIGIGLKHSGGEKTDRLAVTVFVARKHGGVAEGERVPAEVEGFPTDVVEHPPFSIVRTATDPFTDHDPMISGIAVAARESAMAWGSIGCFLHTDGDPANGVDPGNYLLTCEHVLKLQPADRDLAVIQPSTEDYPIPDRYVCGEFVASYLSPTQDCAIVRPRAGRGYVNEVPNYPWHPGRRNIGPVRQALPGDKVYKYGATTRFTKGEVTQVFVQPQGTDYQDVIVVASEDGPGDAWVAKGDSGSVLLRQADDAAIGLNFGGDVSSPAPPPPAHPNVDAFWRGYAYSLRTQMESFVAPGGQTWLV